jgi:glycosyltransferase involved in cell wall biosynthesis
VRSGERPTLDLETKSNMSGSSDSLRVLLGRRDRVGSLGALDYLIERELASLRMGALGSSMGASRVNHNHRKVPEVSVVMTAFNAANTIERSIRSVLSQTLKNIELIVVDDCSSDSTVELINQLASHDNRLHLIRCYKNRGTYWAKNLGILHAKAPYVALHDSDDTSHPQRLAKQLASIENSEINFCYTNWVRLDEHGNPVKNRGLLERLGYPTLFFRKSAIDDFGFFDTTYIAADDEYHSRIKLRYGRTGFVHLTDALYYAPLSPGSLTARNPVHMNLKDESNPLSFLSDDRQSYTRLYNSFHDRVLKGQAQSALPFPQRLRPFSKPLGIRSSEIGVGTLIIGSIATYPKRAKFFEKVVSQLLNQVDILRVHLNNYTEIPIFLNHPKISVTTSQATGDLRDNGKFLAAENLPSGYHLTFDDDLDYPPYYVSYLIAKCMQYGNRVVVGLHGTTINKNFIRYHDKTSRSTDTFRLPLVADKFVSILGTGTTCYHTETLKFGLRDVTSTGMIDLWFAGYCREKGVPMVCVERGANWLSEISGTQDESLYTEFLDSDTDQTGLVRSYRIDSTPLRL